MGGAGAQGSGCSSSARSEVSAGLPSCFSGEKQKDKHGTLGPPPLTKACATLPNCPPDQLETENPGEELEWGP